MVRKLLSAVCLSAAFASPVEASPPERTDAERVAELLELAAEQDDDDAEATIREALEMAETRLGPAAPETLEALARLYEVVHPWRALDIAREIAAAYTRLEPGGDAYLNAWTRVGLAAGAVFREQESAEALRRVVDALEGTQDRASLGRALHNLSGAIRRSGDFDEGRRMEERALVELEAALGPDHLDVARVVDALGQLEFDAGRFAEARRWFERAYEIRFRSDRAGKSFRRAHSLVLLGELARAAGNLDEALSLHEQALQIVLRLSPGNDDIAAIHLRLAKLRVEAGQPDRAAAHLRKVIEVYGARYGADDLRVLEARCELSTLQDDPARAAELWRTLLVRAEETWGPGHRYVAATALSLARVLRRSGRPADALPHAERAASALAEIYGDSHTDVDEAELELARLQWMVGKRELAGERVQSIAARERVRLRNTLGAVPEREALGYAARRSESIDLLLSLAAEEESGAAVAAAWDELIRSRAMVLDELAERGRRVAASSEPEIEALDRRLAGARYSFARALVRGAGEGDPESHRASLAELRRKVDEAERKLAERSLRFRGQLERKRIGLERVQAGLPADASLVAFVRFERHRPRRRPAAEGTRVDLETNSHYAAFVGIRRRPAQWVALGPAAPIDAAVRAWQAAVSNAPPALGSARRTHEERYARVAAELRSLIWDPLPAEARNRASVYVVPDGLLHLVNLATLPDGEVGFLVERATVFRVLTAERDLLPADDGRGSGSGLLALGAPSYDEQPTADAAGLRGEREIACASFHELRVRSLPASRTEVEAIAGLWREGSAEPVATLLGGQARESELKARVSGRRVLHLATHGFFLDAVCTSSLDAPPRGLLVNEEPVGEHPLRLSGLALAGFNRRAEAELEEEDGVLTAEEIAAFDLDGVEWVVLSACDSGLGDVHPREGVLGLRRAFLTAGADTVITSLWSVRDDVARDWMGALYRGRAAGSTAAEAVRHAAREVLRKQTDAGATRHPFYWGAFVAVGGGR